MTSPAPDTPSRILEAALACFVQEGYERTTIAHIRGRSQVSNGALFHHFQSKEAIAEALYVDAISSFQEGLWRLVGDRPRSLRAGVRGTIAHHLGWIERHPDLARFVYQRGHLDWDSPAGEAVAALNQGLAAAFRDWIEALVAADQARPLPMVLVSAIVSGPAHAIARRWLSGQLSRPLDDFVDPLTDAAWAALSGKPAPAPEPDARPPRVGRITVEVLSDHGDVLAQGELTPPSTEGAMP